MELLYIQRAGVGTSAQAPECGLIPINIDKNMVPKYK